MFHSTVFRFLFLCLGAGALPLQAVAQQDTGIPTTIRLASTDWCPYACPNSEERPGIAYEYVRHVLAQNDMVASISFRPWTRAIRDANVGAVHGLLTAVVTEAPNLQLTTTPTMDYRVCFFTKPDSNWRYQGIVSLENQRLGGIQDYGYGPPIDRYIRSTETNNRVVLVAGQNGIERLLSMLQMDRIDILLDDQHVVQWTLKDLDRPGDSVRNAGCMIPHPFYLAVNPDLPWATAFVALMDEQFADPANRQALKNIIRSYAPN